MTARADQSPEIQGLKGRIANTRRAVQNQKYTRHVRPSPSFAQVREHPSDHLRYYTLSPKSETLDTAMRKPLPRRAGEVRVISSYVKQD